jgi:tRNA(fMet)-specific endonuclease VapC
MEIICLDTSVLINHKIALKKAKSETFLYHLAQKYQFAITVVSVYELLRGDNNDENKFWMDFFSKVTVLPFDFESSVLAGKIDKELIRQGNKIKVTDLFIASITIRNGMLLATEDKKDFTRIRNLKFILP